MSASSRRTRRGTDEPAAAPAAPQARPPVGNVPSARSGGVEVLLAESVGSVDPALIGALQSLQSHGIIRVVALIEGDGHPRQVLRHSFPEAVPAGSLPAVVAPPGSLVILLTPPHLHPTQFAAAAKRGWHVLTLTPLARSAVEATTMFATAQRQERVLAAGFPRRFLPPLQYVRVLCRDQLLGPVVSVNVHDGAPPPAADAPKLPDGVLIDVGLPAFDLLTWCLGPATVVNYADDAMGGVEANALADLAFADGVTGRVHLSRDWPTSQSYEFVFERGIARWHATRPQRLTLQLASAPSALDAAVIAPITPAGAARPDELDPSPTDSFVALIRNALGVIAGRERLVVPPTEALEALALVDACYRRRTLLPQPWLSHNETAHARRLVTPAEL